MCKAGKGYYHMQKADIERRRWGNKDILRLTGWVFLFFFCFTFVSLVTLGWHCGWDADYWREQGPVHGQLGAVTGSHCWSRKDRGYEGKTAVTQKEKKVKAFHAGSSEGQGKEAWRGDALRAQVVGWRWQKPLSWCLILHQRPKTDSYALQWFLLYAYI